MSRELPSGTTTWAVQGWKQGCLGTVWQSVQQCSKEIFGMKLHVTNLVAGCLARRCLVPVVGVLRPTKLTSRLDAPPTELPIVQQPRGDGHQWGSSPARPESRVPQTTEHEVKCCCLLHPNLALLKIDSQNLGQTSVMSGRELLHNFRPEARNKKSLVPGHNAIEEAMRTLRGGFGPETSHVLQTRPSDAC